MNVVQFGWGSQLLRYPCRLPDSRIPTESRKSLNELIKLKNVRYLNAHQRYSKVLFNIIIIILAKYLFSAKTNK